MRPRRQGAAHRFGEEIAATGRLHEAGVETPAATVPGPRLDRAPDGSEGPHPVLLDIHGGPYAQYGWTLFDEAQVYAGAGYAVVLCNPAARPDTGRRTAGRSGMRWATGTPPTCWRSSTRPWPARRLDAERVGVMGGSYGGFMTTWLVGARGTVSRRRSASGP